MPHYKLTYFYGRGRAEFIRMLFAAAKVPYEEDTQDYMLWTPEVKAKFPLGQLPTLHVDGKLLFQSETIGRYLAREFGWAPKTNWEMAQMEQYIDGVTDMQNAMQEAILPHIIAGNIEQKDIAYAKFRDEKFKPWMVQYSKFLESNKSCWFVGDKPTLADIRVAEFVERMDQIYTKGLVDGYPVLKAHIQRLNALPGIAERVTNRPKDYTF